MNHVFQNKICYCFSLISEHFLSYFKLFVDKIKALFCEFHFLKRLGLALYFEMCQLWLAFCLNNLYCMLLTFRRFLLTFKTNFNRCGKN